jgi:hypothetical protein
VVLVPTVVEVVASIAVVVLVDVAAVVVVEGEVLVVAPVVDGLMVVGLVVALVVGGAVVDVVTGGGGAVVSAWMDSTSARHAAAVIASVMSTSNEIPLDLDGIRPVSQPTMRLPRRSCPTRRRRRAAGASPARSAGRS